MNVSFGSTLDATSGIAALTGYEGEEPRISGMDVNYPDQIVSLFATGMVITAVMEARRTGKGLPFSTSPNARSPRSPSARRSWPPPPIRQRSQAPRGNRAGWHRPAGHLLLPRRALDRRHADQANPGLDAFCASRDSAEAVAGTAGARHRRRAVQRRRRPAARQGAGRRDPRARRARRAGERPALSPRRPRHRHRARRAGPWTAHRRGVAHAVGLQRCRSGEAGRGGRHRRRRRRRERADHGACRSPEADRAHGDAGHRRADVPGLQSRR